MCGGTGLPGHDARDEQVLGRGALEARQPPEWSYDRAHTELTKWRLCMETWKQQFGLWDVLRGQLVSPHALATTVVELMTGFKRPLY